MTITPPERKDKSPRGGPPTAQPERFRPIDEAVEIGQLAGSLDQDPLSYGNSAIDGRDITPLIEYKMLLKAVGSM
ncbi:hypothetical protein GCM10010129_04210 [Streptomyces fumigatiscleroticus]|nr:hypothetical protein GCM10010129_04210 [Streptomyces fumigatiscleroticus]